MSAVAKKGKVGSQPRPPTCKYEKARRDRLNLFITELSTFLPEQNPAKSLSKIDILEKIVQLIKCLLEDKEKLTNKSSADELLKQEIKELKFTVLTLKGRIATLNKILKEANIAVSQDLEMPQFDNNFTPHLRYSCPKRAQNHQHTQTEPITASNETQKQQPNHWKPRETPGAQTQANSTPKEKENENEEESVEKLISFTKQLKAPLKEIQVNVSRVAIPPPPPQPPLPPQIIVVPYFFPPRPALTQLTFSNKRPISSYTDFKKIYNEQQEKLERKRRRKKQKKKPPIKTTKKCCCQTVVLKKPDGALKKIIKLCGYKMCKNKTKFQKIHEQAKQQLSEQAKEDKAKEQKTDKSHKTINTNISEQVLEDAGIVSSSMEVDNTMYSEPGLGMNMENRNNTYDTKSHKGTEKQADGFNLDKPLLGESQFTFSQKEGPDKHSEDCYYPCTNFFNSMNSSYPNEELDYQSSNKHTKESIPNHAEENGHNDGNVTHKNEGISTRNDRLNQNPTSHCNNPLSTNQRSLHDVMGSNNNRVMGNPVSHSIESLNHNSADIRGKQEIYANRNLVNINSNVEHVCINGAGNSINTASTSSMRDKSKDIATNVSRENNVGHSSGNHVITTATGSYSINSVIFSNSRSQTSETPCTSLYGSQTQFSSYAEQNAKTMPHKEGPNIPRNQGDQKVTQETNNKRSVRKNLTFSFENLGSNVMSSETGETFGYNESGTSGALYPLLGNLNESNYNNTDQPLPSFYKNTAGDTLSYAEPSQDKSSCYFESHPNSLHFPYVPVSDTPLIPVTKSFDETKRKSNMKQKPDTCHDISQNIFEVNNKENSFDFLFGKQNSLNTPQKTKRKGDNCLLSEKTFLLEEMRFHSEFSNDLFSLPGQVGAQNLECVSPTAAFLHTFPRSAKQTELLPDNIESGNTSTPIGNIESLSQDMTDFTFKSNVKGLFDPFYPSLIPSDTKLNFDFNTGDNVPREDLLKPTFPSCADVAGTPWSANIFSIEESPKKKTHVESESQLLNTDKKLAESVIQDKDTKPSQSKCSQTLFSYTDTGNTAKSLVNWMTSADGKKSASAMPCAPLEPSASLDANPLLPSYKPVTTFPAIKSNSLSWQDPPVSSHGNTKAASHSYDKTKVQEQQPAMFVSNSKEVISLCNARKPASEVVNTHSSSVSANTSQQSNQRSEGNKKYTSSTMTQPQEKDNFHPNKTNKESFVELPNNIFNEKSTPKSVDKFICPPVQYYHANPPTSDTCSNASSFLSVSQLVDPVKPEFKQKEPSYQNKATEVKKEKTFSSNLKESMEHDTKYNNYSTEALLSSPQKLHHHIPVHPPPTKAYKLVETKTRYKRKRSDSKTSKNVPVTFSSIYNVTSTDSLYSGATAASSIYSNSNYYSAPNSVGYNSYYMGSSSAGDTWNNYPSKTSTNTYDTTPNQQMSFKSGNYLPAMNQNYFSSGTPSVTGNSSQNDKYLATPYYQNPIFTSANISEQHHVTSSSFISPQSQQNDTNMKQCTARNRNVNNSNSSTSRTSSISVGTQVVTSNFPYLPTSHYKPVTAASNITLNTTIHSLPWVSSANSYTMAPSWHVPVSISSTQSYVSSTITRSPYISSSSSSLAMSASKSFTMPAKSSHSTSSTIASTSSTSAPIAMKPLEVTTVMTPHTSPTSASVSKSSHFSSPMVSNGSVISSLPSVTSVIPVSTSTNFYVNAIPPPIPSVVGTSVPYPPYSVTPSIYSSRAAFGSTSQFSDSSLYTPKTTSNYSSNSTSNISNKEAQSTFTSKSTSSSSGNSSLKLNSSNVSSSGGNTSLAMPSNISTSSFNLSYSGLNTFVTSSGLSYSRLNTSVTSSSLSYSGLNTSVTSSSLSYAGLNTSVTSSSLSYAGLNTSITSSGLSSSRKNTSVKSSTSSYSVLNTSVTSSCLTYPGIKMSVTSSTLPYSGLNTSVTSSSLTYSGIKMSSTSSRLSNSGINYPNTSVTSSGLSYPSIHGSVTSSNLSYSGINISVTSSNLPYSGLNSLNTSVPSSGLSYAGINNSIPSSSLSYSGISSPVTSSVSSSRHHNSVTSSSSSTSYSGLNTSVTSSFYYLGPNNALPSNNLSTSGHNTSVPSSSSSSSRHKSSVQSSNLSYHSVPKTSVTSSNSSYSGVNSTTTSYLSYSGLNTSVTSSNLSNFGLTSSVTSCLSYSTLNTSFPSTLSYSGLNTSAASSSLPYASLNTSASSSSIPYSTGMSVPYSSMSLYPPVTSSVTDFNLSTIFPEIMDKTQNPTRSGQHYNQQRNYTRSKCHKP